MKWMIQAAIMGLVVLVGCSDPADGTRDGCSPAEQNAIWTSAFQDKVKSCGKSALGGADKTDQCLSPLYGEQAKNGVSSQCLDCFGKSVACMAAECLSDISTGCLTDSSGEKCKCCYIEKCVKSKIAATTSADTKSTTNTKDKPKSGMKTATMPAEKTKFSLVDCTGIPFEKFNPGKCGN